MVSKKSLDIGSFSVVYSVRKNIVARRFALLFLNMLAKKNLKVVICTIAVARDGCTSLHFAERGDKGEKMSFNYHA